jgi:hypothetical protein
MLWYWLLFIFVAFGAKLLLALVMIYLLLPGELRCNQCDHETLLIRSKLAGRLGSALTLGRVQWRWCPRCGWEGLGRRIRDVAEPSARELRSRGSPRGRPMRNL